MTFYRQVNLELKLSNSKTLHFIFFRIFGRLTLKCPLGDLLELSKLPIRIPKTHMCLFSDFLTVFSQFDLQITLILMRYRQTNLAFEFINEKYKWTTFAVRKLIINNYNRHCRHFTWCNHPVFSLENASRGLILMHV